MNEMTEDAYSNLVALVDALFPPDPPWPKAHWFAVRDLMRKARRALECASEIAFDRTLGWEIRQWVHVGAAVGYLAEAQTHRQMAKIGCLCCLSGRRRLEIS